MVDFFGQAVDAYLEATGITKCQLTKLATPFIDMATQPDAAYEGQGELSEESCGLLMKLLYGGRFARGDIMRPINMLSRRVSKWRRIDDLRLRRILCYVNSTVEHKQVAIVGDDINNVYLESFVDADLASDKDDTKSSNGYFLAISGDNTFAVLSFGHKKQTSTALGTPKAEIVSMGFGMKFFGLPALDCWETVLQRDVQLIAREDNESTISIALAGYSPALRHVETIQKTSISWISERFKEESATVLYVPTEEQVADSFTKDLKALGWPHALQIMMLEVLGLSVNSRL